MNAQVSHSTNPQTLWYEHAAQHAAQAKHDKDVEHCAVLVLDQYNQMARQAVLALRGGYSLAQYGWHFWNEVYRRIIR